MDCLSLTIKAVSAVALYLLSCAIYNVFFHPLRSYPGPKLWAASHIPYSAYSLQGRIPFEVKKLHDQYGDIVRVAPNYLSYISEQAWEDINGHIKGTKMKSFEKDAKYRAIVPAEGVTNILIADDADHRRLRKLQSHAFSEKALLSQEDILQHYIRMFVTRLCGEIDTPSKGVVPINQYYNWATFDVISDLTYGESFHCLERKILHPWIVTIFGALKAGTFILQANHYPAIKLLLKAIIPKSIKQQAVNHSRYSADRVDKRLAEGTDRPDFMSYMLRNNDTENSMTDAELKEGSGVFIIAGSETTATLLTGTTYHLLKSPVVLEKLTREIRNAFETECDLTLQKLSRLPYLMACLEEGMRIHPPAPSTFPRVVPEGGDMICGQFVPEGTTVGVNQWAAHHCERNFSDPESFHPERWMNDAAFVNDNLKARQPFSYGPRNCIGKNLAYAEMRLLLANLLWHFDIKSVEKTKWFENNQIFTLWHPNEDLMIQLSPRTI